MKIKDKLFNAYKKVSETVLPINTTSTFKEKGELTPAEFLLAGDYLVQSCPTWSWESGDEAKRHEFLPPNKQYLVTRNVPCLQRASTVEEYASIVDTDGNATVKYEEKEVEGGEWVDTPSSSAVHTVDEDFEVLPPSRSSRQFGGHVPDIEQDDEAIRNAAAGGSGGDNGSEMIQGDIDDIPDITDLSLEGKYKSTPTAVGVEAAKAASALTTSAPPAVPSGVLRTRTYDVIISYDIYYRVPRVWLLGYDENRKPLSVEHVMQDVVKDYQDKTVDVKSHPHKLHGGRMLSIHPCRHAETMHRLAGYMAEGGGGGGGGEASGSASQGQELKVEHYLIVFLKFISGVVPTIEYDFTYSA